MTKADLYTLRQRCADHDARIDTRLRQLFDPESRQKRRRRARVQRSAWITANAPQKPASDESRSILDGLQSFTGYVTPRTTVKGKGITLNPANPASGAPEVDPARMLRDMEIRALAKTGRTHRQIAAIVSTSVSTVGRVLRQATPEAPAA